MDVSIRNDCAHSNRMDVSVQDFGRADVFVQQTDVSDRNDCARSYETNVTVRNSCAHSDRTDISTPRRFPQIPI